MEPLLIRAEEAAKLLGLGRSKVFQMIAVGELPVVRMGRSVRVPRAELVRWIESRTAGRADEAGALPSGAKEVAGVQTRQAR